MFAETFRNVVARPFRSLRLAALLIGGMATLTVPTHATSPGHVLEVHEDGSLWASGVNDFGQLGDGTHTARTELQKVAGLSGVIQAVACPHHSLALTSDGNVWGWGDNRRGQLGDNSRLERQHPTRVLVLNGVASISCGDVDSEARKGDGSTWRWGGVHGEDPNEDELVPSPVNGPDALRER